MQPGSLEDFLAAVHADPLVQQALAHPGSRECAVRIARAAGWNVGASDLIATPERAVPEGPGETPPVEGETVDFDGDGILDAVVRGGRWVMLEGEE
jgi:hypothetical protein